MKSPLNLRQLETFRAAMISGSVVGAAKLMNVTQPGVSRTIGMLEDRLGYALFLRRGRRIVATPEAEALYREVEKSYRSIEYVTRVALDIGAQRAGRLRIASLPSLSQWFVPKVLSEFILDRPDVTAFLQSLPSAQIAELVSTAQFDLGVVELPLSRSAIDIEELPSAALVAVIPARHALASLPEVSLKDLDGERMILLSQHSFLRYQIDDAFSACGATPQIVVETPSFTIACAFVAAGAGITVASPLTAKPFVNEAVVVRPLREAIKSRHAVIFPQVTTRSILSLAFASQLKQNLTEYYEHPTT